MQRKKWKSRLRAGVAALGLLLGSAGLYCAGAAPQLPTTLTAAQTEQFALGGKPLFTVDPKQQQIRLLGAVPVASVEVQQASRTRVRLCGTAFGLKMYADGALIVEVGTVDTADGSRSPAKEAGLQTGDVIRAVNGEKVSGNRDASDKISACGGAEIRLTVDRSGKELELLLRPAYSQSARGYKAGLWIKDSCAGIGTMTFVTEEGKFAGLGHGITDADTGCLMPVEYGQIVPVTLSGVTKGLRGSPGELKGYFASEEVLGTIDRNCTCGVFGTAEHLPEGVWTEVAFRQEVYRGKAQILTTVAGDTPRWYDAEIERIRYDQSAQGQNMVVRITDPELLAATGGIIQGMSGSVLVQDGRLVGAITHVFIGDPTRGYAIFAENMLDAAA